MTKKSLILYASVTGNTEKVALRFKEEFLKKGWECDMFKVDKKTDIKNPPFDFSDYDFLCIGSPVHDVLPVKEVIKIMFNSPLSAHYPPKAGRGGRNYRRVIIGPKKGVVFATYAGSHLGPKEAEPALSLLGLEMEHLKFECIGKFACPGAMASLKNRPTPRYWHKDIHTRPNERDLMKAEIFLSEIIEDVYGTSPDDIEMFPYGQNICIS